MPELPEVEVTRLSFASRIAGAKILRVFVGKPLRWPLGCSPDSLSGKSILGVRRRSKYLLIDLDDGLLLLHLGMSGSLRFSSDLPPPDKHDHFELETSLGTLRLHDPRRFGAVVFAPSESAPPALKLLEGLGPEPLGEDFSPGAFHTALKSRTASVKEVLMSGSLVVGAGNIYAAEALFHARIRPTLRSNKLSKAAAFRLHAAIRSVISHAIEIGGTTLRNYSNAEGKPGYFQFEAMVYGREGLPCRVCSTPIKRIVQAQRSTFFCPICQKSS